MSSPKDIEAKINTVSSAWEGKAPNASFGGMTLAQFKAATKPSLDTRAAIAGWEQNIKDTTNQRDDADKVSVDKCDLVVKGVVGDPNFGDDSSLYEAMGYVRSSERQTGLTRKKSAPAKATA
jgi:hypothetical protein